MQKKAQCICIFCGLLFFSSQLFSQSFTDVTAQSGVALTHATDQAVVDIVDFQQNIIDNIPEFNIFAHLISSWLTGGVAVGDYDGDSWPDLFVIGGNVGSSKLFRNRGDGTFEDVTDAVGLANLSGRIAGAVFADFDGDGQLDLFLGGALGQLPRLLKNNTNVSGEFIDVFQSALIGYDVGSAPNAWGGAFGDYNNDGCLDLLIPHSVTPFGPTPPMLTTNGSTQHLWMNRCDGTFIDQSNNAGISALFDVNDIPGGRDQTFTGNFSDINNDGLSDLLLTGDSSSDLILINQGNGRFIDQTDREIINDHHAMGSAVGDLNNDGNMDWFTSNIGHPQPGNRVYYGLGDGNFTNGTEGSGLKEGHWGWGSCMLDINLDRHLDIFHVNGYYNEGNLNPDAVEERFDNAPAVLFVSQGDGTFIEQAVVAGLDDRGEGRGVSCFDYDRDGDVDIAISNHKGAFKLFRNNLNAANRNYLTIKLNGLRPNAQAIGAKVFLSSENNAETGELLREVRLTNNFLSSNLAEAHFGLGDWQGPFKLRVVWPNGEIISLGGVSKNQLFEVAEYEAPIFANSFE